MPSTYTLNNGIELIATGEQSGTWGDTTNTNFELLDTALDGQVSVTLAATGSSGSPNTLPISDGASSNGRNRLVIFGDGGDLGGTAFVQLTPNDAEKIIYVRNNLSGSRSILLFQGTYNASNDYEVPAGTTAVVFFDGAGSGAVAANVFNNAFFDSLRLGGVSVTAILDEDDMSSNSATALSTQQSIKAYVDSQVGTVDTLAEILANGNTTGGTDIAVSTGDDITFADSSKAIFGAGSDLQIYHNGNNSYIQDTGTGKLHITSDGTGVSIDKGTSELMATFDIDGAVTLYYDNAVKLATTSTGVDIKNTSDPVLKIQRGTGSYSEISSDSNGTLFLRADEGNTTSSSNIRFEVDNTEYLRLDEYGQLILQSNPSTFFLGGTSTGSLVKGTSTGNYLIFGTSGSEVARFVGSNLGIGTTSPSTKLELASNDATNSGLTNLLTLTHTTTGTAGDGIGTRIVFNAEDDAGSGVSTMGYIDTLFTDVSDGAEKSAFAFSTRNGGSIAERMRIDSSGNVGIGVTPSAWSTFNALEMSNGVYLGSYTGGTTAGYLGTNNYFNGSNFIYKNSDFATRYQQVDGEHQWYTAPSGTAGNSISFSQAMTLDASGNVGIGTSSPTYELDVTASDTTSFAMWHNSTTGSGASNGLLVGNSANDAIFWNYENATMQFATNNTERMRIDSSGNVGIGTSSPSDDVEISTSADGKGLTIKNAGNNRPYLNFDSNRSSAGNNLAQLNFKWNGTDVARIIAVAGSDTTNKDDGHITFSTSSTGSVDERMRIDSEGRVGIGITPAAIADNTGVDSLQLGGSFLSHFDEDGPGSTILGNNIYYNGTANKALFTGATSQYYQAGGTHVWRNSGSTSAGSTATMTEAMRINSSNHLLIGKTADDNTTAGIALHDNGFMSVARSSNIAMLLDRHDSDGEILRFTKGGADVGSIATDSGYLKINSGNASFGSGIEFHNLKALPVGANGASSNGTVSLGESGRAWNDLYLSGGIQFDSRSNKLDDYEEGTWTPTLAAGTPTINATSQYTKVGNLVTIFLDITYPVQTNGNDADIFSLPFTSAASIAQGAVAIFHNYSISSNVVGIMNLNSTRLRLFNGSGTSLSLTNMSGKDLRITAQYTVS